MTSISPRNTRRSVSPIPWISPEIRRKLRGNKVYVKKTSNGKLRTKFKLLGREIKVYIKKQPDLHVNNLAGDVKAKPRDFYRYNCQKKIVEVFNPLCTSHLKLPLFLDSGDIVRPKYRDLTSDKSRQCLRCTGVLISR